jgi:hypothetical protein
VGSHYLLRSILSSSCDELKLKKTINFCLYKDTEDLSNLPFDVPNGEEIKRSVAVTSPSHWRLELKKSRSLRVRNITSLKTPNYDREKLLKYTISSCS